MEIRAEVGRSGSADHSHCPIAVSERQRKDMTPSAKRNEKRWEREILI